ncbi:MAG: tetratricopeptide repeat protein [Candidatus Brocadiaceae bacterium]|nr:tetratricopeptide repeat protein [Candidatus Brocadiaceae bacterium]
MERYKMSTNSCGLRVLFVAMSFIAVMCSSIAYAEKETSSNMTQGVQQGLIYVKLNRHTDAVVEFKKELAKNPDNTDAYYHLGNSYFKLKEYDKAETATKNAIKLKPDFSEARYQLAVIAKTRAEELRKLNKGESIVLEKLLEAEDLCREIIEKDQNFLKSYFLLGQIHLMQGLLDDAIIDHKHLLDVDNTYVDCHISLAQLYSYKGELDLAVKECNLVLSEFEPGNTKAMFLLSTIHEQTKKHDEAVGLLKQILEKKPEDFNAQIQLGLLYLRLSKYDEAFEQAENMFKQRSSKKPGVAFFIKGSVWLQRRNYEKAVSNLKEAILRQPDMLESHYFLAHGLVGLGRTQEAINEFNKAIKIAPTYIPAKSSLARLLSRTGGWERETTRLCKDILEIKPDHEEALRLLGQSYIEERDFENAELLFRKINEKNPSVGGINMAYLSLVSGKLSRCIRQCKAIIDKNPDEIRAHNILGLAHIRQGNFDIGIKQYKKVLEIDPKSISTLINIAKAYVVTDKNDEAKEALNNVITIDPNNLQSRVLLAGIYRKEGNIDETAKLFEQAIEISPDDERGYALAGIYLLQGKADTSIELCNKAIKLNPDNVTFYTNLAISYQHRENYVGSIKFSEKAVELIPEDPSVKIILINNYAANGDYRIANDQVESISTFTEDEKKAYHELLDLCQLNSEKGKQIALSLNRSLFARGVGFFDLAISECKGAVEIFPENVVAKVILANNYLNMNRNEDAIAIYSEIIKDKPEFASSYYSLGAAYLKADKQDEAISTYENLVGVDSKSVAGRLALARMLVKKGETDKAAKMINDVIEIDPDNLMAHDLLGNVSLAEKDYEKAEKEFLTMIELGRDSFEGHFNMARIKLTQGDFDTCIKHCKSALEIRPLDVRIQNILGIAYVKKGQLKDAVFAFNKIIDIDSDFIQAYLNLAKINIRVKKPGVAALLYRTALKVDPDAVEARLGLGNCYASIGNYSKAITEFESVSKKYPKNTNAYISLARAYLASDNDAKAQEAVTSALGLEPDNPMARYILAKIYAKKSEIQQAILQLTRVLPDNPKISSLYELGVFYIDIEDYDNAVITYKQGVANFPENNLLWCNLAVAYLMNKDFDSAKVACNKAIEVNPDSVIPNLCMVYIHLANGKYGKARRHLEGKTEIHHVQKEMYFGLLELCNQNREMADKVSYHLARTLAYTNYGWSDRVLQECDEVIKIVPTNAVAYKVQANTLGSIGEVDKVIEVCNKLVELEPENPVFYIKLANIYRRKGEMDEALVQCRKAVGVAPDNVTAHMGIGILLESKSLLEESVEAYKKVIELDPTSPMAYNNIAWIYASKMKANMDEAMKLAERAKELSPNDPNISDTLGWIYYMDSKYDKAVLLLRAAVQNATWNPTIRYHLGMAYYKKGLQKEALLELQRAFKISNTFPEAGEAKEVIEKITVSMINETDNSAQNQDSTVSVSD